MHGVGIEPSTEHMKVTFCWSEWNVKVALWRPLIAGGPEAIVVSGSPTTVQVWRAGVGSTLSDDVHRADLERVLAGASRPSSSSTASQPENCSPSSEHSNSSTSSLLWKPKIASGTGDGTRAVRR